MGSLLDTDFVPEWVTIGETGMVPRIDWIDRKALDVPYGDDPRQRLDIYLPEGEGPFPLVVLVHGGGFALCDKRDWHLYPGFFALRDGFALASVNYRLVPDARFPDPVEDLGRAIAYARDHADEYGIDPTRVCLYGTSAGGNLVTLVGLQSAGGPRAVSAVAALCPILDFENEAAFFEVLGALAPEYVTASRQMMEAYLGAAVADDPETARAAGAARYLSSSAPPFYIQHGMLDPAVPVEQAFDFAAALGAAIGEDKVVFDRLRRAGHAGGGPEFLEEEHIRPILDFFKRNV